MVPISSIAVTRIGPRIFGRIWRTIICPELFPDSLAAAMKEDSFSARVWLRATRAYFGQLMTASAMTALLTPPPSSAAIARAKTMESNTPP